MRTSFYVSPRSRVAEEQRALLDLIEELTLIADEAGFAGVFLTEHHLSSHNPFQNSLQYASYLAGKLRQAYLGLCTVNPTLHNPLRLVEQCNLLDLLTRGRLVVGIGSGFVDEEYHAFGRDPEQRAQLLGQTLDVLDTLWNYRDGDEPYEFTTLAESGRIHRAVTPGPYRSPRPITGRASMTASTLIDTAERGWAALVSLWTAADAKELIRPYFEALESAGHSAETVANCREWTGIMKWIHVAETDAEAKAELETTIDRWLEDPTHPGQARLHAAVDAATPEITRAAAASGAKDPRVALRRQLICGSPETVIAQMNEYAESGVGHLMGMFLRDRTEEASVRRSMQLFIDEVMPKISGATVPA